MKRVSVVGTVGIPACYGGFESLVENLTRYAGRGISYIVFCSQKAYLDKIDSHNDAQLIYLPLSANGFQSIFYDVLSLIRCLFLKPDVTVILGVSGCAFLPIYRLLSKSKVITNIDGLEWRRPKWSKFARKFLKFSEKLAVNFSDVIIADNQGIGDYVKSEYGKDAAIIAYGGDHALPAKSLDVLPDEYYLSLCRIEPENNVSMILEAFAKSGKKLKFIGNWDSSDYGIELKSKYCEFDNIDIIDPVYDIENLYILRKACKGYVHGHSAGGTNPSLVEAMHFEKPVLAFDCIFNRYTTEDKACYFSDVIELVGLLDDLDLKSREGNISSDMKDIAVSRYTWKVISKQYEDLY